MKVSSITLELSEGFISPHRVHLERSSFVRHCDRPEHHFANDLQVLLFPKTFLISYQDNDFQIYVSIFATVGERFHLFVSRARCLAFRRLLIFLSFREIRFCDLNVQTSMVKLECSISYIPLIASKWVRKTKLTSASSCDLIYHCWESNTHCCPFKS